MKDKGTKFITGIVCMFMLISSTSYSQTKSHWKEFVAGLSPYDNTQLDHLLAEVNLIHGVKYQGYCKDHRCLLLLFDAGIYESEEEVVSVFAEHKITLLPKFNTDFKTITATCGALTLTKKDN